MTAVLVRGHTAMQGSPFLPQRWPKPLPVRYSLHWPTKGWPTCVAWMNTGMVNPPKVVTDASSNRAQHSWTLYQRRYHYVNQPKARDSATEIHWPNAVVITTANTDAADGTVSRSGRLLNRTVTTPRHQLTVCKYKKLFFHKVSSVLFP